MKKYLLLFMTTFQSYKVAFSATPNTKVENNFAENLTAISQFAWPLVVLIIIWSLLPEIKKIAKSRNFSIKVAGIEVNVQSMADQLNKQIHELQKKTIELDCEINKSEVGIVHSGDGNINKKLSTILWITGNFQGHAFEIDSLEKDGITVIKALSNDEALDILSLKSKNIDGIITGVSRYDRGIFYPKAGVDFIIKAKELKYEIPIFVLCSERNIKEYYTALKAAGAIEATSSSLELVSLLHKAGINCNTIIEKSHIAHLDAMKDEKK